MDRGVPTRIFPFEDSQSSSSGEATRTLPSADLPFANEPTSSHLELLDVRPGGSASASSLNSDQQESLPDSGAVSTGSNSNSNEAAYYVSSPPPELPDGSGSASRDSGSREKEESTSPPLAREASPDPRFVTSDPHLLSIWPTGLSPSAQHSSNSSSPQPPLPVNSSSDSNGKVLLSALIEFVLFTLVFITNDLSLKYLNFQVGKYFTHFTDTHGRTSAQVHSDARSNSHSHSPHHSSDSHSHSSSQNFNAFTHAANSGFSQTNRRYHSSSSNSSPGIIPPNGIGNEVYSGSFPPQGSLPHGYYLQNWNDSPNWSSINTGVGSGQVASGNLASSNSSVVNQGNTMVQVYTH